MTYKQFRSWCNDRSCDGQWGMYAAMVCIEIIEQIEAVKAPGFHLLRKRADDKAKEEAWQKLNSESKIGEIFMNRTEVQRSKRNGL